MADNQRIIEILLQFKQANQELVKQATDAIQGITPAANRASAATDALATEATKNLQAVGAVGNAAGQQVAQGMQQGAAAGAQSFRQMLQDINDEVGKRSTFGMVTRLLAGGGVVGGIALLGRELNKATKEMAGLSDQFRAGTISGGEFAEKMAASLPLLGQFWEAGRNIREMFTGEEQEAKKAADAWNQTMKAIDASGKAMVENLQAIKKARDEALATGQGEAKPAVLRDAMLQQANEGGKASPSQQMETAISLAVMRVEQERAAILAKLDAAAVAPNDAYQNARTQKEDAQQKLKDEMDEQALQTSIGRPDRNDANKLALLQADFKNKEEVWRQALKDVLETDAKLKAEREIINKYFEDKAKADSADAAGKIAGPALAAGGAGLSKIAGAFSAAAEAADGKKSWSDFFNVVSANADKWRQEMENQAQKVRDAMAGPEGKAQDEKAALRALFGGNAAGIKFIDQATFDAGMKAVDAKLDEAQAKEIQSQDELNIRMAQGTDKLKAQAKQAYDQDVAAFKAALDQKPELQAQIDAALAAREQALQDDLVKIDQNAADEKLAANLKLQRELWRDNDQQMQQYRQSQNQQRGGFFGGMTQGFIQLEAEALSAEQIGQRVSGEFADGFANAFVGAIMGAKNFGQAFQQMAASILEDLAKILVQQSVVSMFGGIFGAFSGGEAGFGRSGINALGGLFGGNTGGLLTAGGFVRGFSSGGFVGSSFSGPNRDTIPAMLTQGEYVIPKPIVQAPGVLSMLENLRGGLIHRNLGGSIGEPPLSAMKGNRGGAGGVHIAPAIIANDASVRTLLAGGQNAVIDFLRSNAGKVNAALGNRGQG